MGRHFRRQDRLDVLATALLAFGEDVASKSSKKHFKDQERVARITANLFQKVLKAGGQPRAIFR